MSKNEELAQELCKAAAERLHHLSMRYVGALHEVALGKPVGLIPKTHPGNYEMRDLIDLVLLTRAEINALTALLVKKQAFTSYEYIVQCTEEYEWFTKQKAEQLGCEVSDAGLVFKTKKGGQ